MIAIINYGSGNISAISNILKQLKSEHIISNDKDELRRAERYILPGVGAFDPTMRNLRQSGLVNLLTEEVVDRKKKILGICVGMQILGEISDEGSELGLGWIRGKVKRINSEFIANRPKLPHMGWNSIIPNKTTSLLNNVDVDRGFYFLHSYFFDAKEGSDVVATVKYGSEMTCIVAHNNVYGTQFHPEKSHSNGVALIRNFASI